MAYGRFWQTFQISSLQSPQHEIDAQNECNTWVQKVNAKYERLLDCSFGESGKILICVCQEPSERERE